MQSSGKGWSGRLFVSVYMCVGEVSGETYRELQAAITLATDYKYFHIYNWFFQWLQRGSGLSSLWTSAPSTLGDQAILHHQNFTNKPASTPAKLLWLVVDIETGTDSPFMG